MEWRLCATRGIIQLAVPADLAVIREVVTPHIYHTLPQPHLGMWGLGTVRSLALRRAGGAESACSFTETRTVVVLSSISWAVLGRFTSDGKSIGKNINGRWHMCAETFYQSDTTVAFISRLERNNIIRRMVRIC